MSVRIFFEILIFNIFLKHLFKNQKINHWDILENEIEALTDALKINKTLQNLDLNVISSLNSIKI